MKITKLKFEEAPNYLLPNIANKVESAFYCVADKTSVYAGLQDGLDEKYCKENNILISRLNYQGGIIVAESGDIDFSVIKTNGWNVGKDFLKKMQKYLFHKGYNSEIEGNDLLIDHKYKVCSYGSRNLDTVAENARIYTAVHINMNSNLEHIKAICKKEMVKVPKGLAEFGLTFDEIEKFLLEFINLL